MLASEQDLPDRMAELLANTLPFLSVNCIIFRFRKGRLEFVACKLAGTGVWLLPGGFIHNEEDVYKAAQRVLFEDTGISKKRLSQFGVFGKANRNFSTDFQTEETKDLLNNEIKERVAERYIAIAYYCILNEEVVLKPNFFFDEVKWHDTKADVNLGMDHVDIIKAARVKLRSELQSQPVLRSFLPDVFTMPDMQALYEAILDRPVDRGNFRRRILKHKFLIEVGESKEKTGRRPRKLYRFDEDKYMDSLTDEVKLGF